LISLLYFLESRLEIGNSLFKKIILLLLVWYAVTRHAITFRNYLFMWWSAVVKVMFNTCFSSVMYYIGKFYFEKEFWIVISNYLGRIICKLSLQDRLFFWIIIYHGFWNNQVIFYAFFFVGN
jgi:hypothetical protein